MPAFLRMRFWFVIAMIVSRAAHADLATDGKLLPAHPQSVTIGDVLVTVEVDRSVVITGQTVNVTLAARKPVTVDVTALHTSNYPGDMTDTAWTQIAHKTVALTGAAPATIAFTLGTRPGRRGLLDLFKIFVAAPGATVPKFEQYPDGPTFEQVVEAGTGAAIEIRGWSGNTLDLTIEPEGKVALDAPFVVAVRLKNTSGGKLPERPEVHLVTSAPDTKIEEVEDPDTSRKAWAKGAAYVARFKVTPGVRSARQLAFLATAFVTELVPGALHTAAGAIDAATFPVMH